MKLGSTLTIPLLWATLAIHVPATGDPGDTERSDTSVDPAADETSQTDTDADTDARSDAYARATELLGREVRTMQGQPLGELRDIVIEPRTGAVKYAVLARGGNLGVGAELHALPLRALSQRPDGEHLVGNLKPEQLDEARGFDDDNWPDAANHALADPELARPAMGGTPGERKSEATGDAADQTATGGGADARARADRPRADDAEDRPVAERGDEMAQRATDEAQREVARIRDEIRNRGLGANARIIPLDRENLWAHKASGLVGAAVRSGAEELGTISDLIINFEHGRVGYAILSYGGTLGVGDRRVAVPWSAVDIDRDDDVLTLDAQRQILDQLAFEGDGPDFADEQWARRTHRAFGTEPEQDVFGYSIDTDDREGGQAQRPERQPQQPREQETTSP